MLLYNNFHSSEVKIVKSPNLQLLENRIPHQTFLVVADNNRTLDILYFTELALCRRLSVVPLLRFQLFVPPDDS